MEYPQKDEMAELMGKRVSFNAEYYKTGKPEEIDKSKIDMHWEMLKSNSYKTGWIVGFSFCCEGILCTEYAGWEEGYSDKPYKKWITKKRVYYVAVREKPNSPILKVPAEFCEII
jgi:hypothetical protein